MLVFYFYQYNISKCTSFETVSGRQKVASLVETSTLSNEVEVTSERDSSIWHQTGIGYNSIYTSFVFFLYLFLFVF